MLHRPGPPTQCQSKKGASKRERTQPGRIQYQNPCSRKRLWLYKERHLAEKYFLKLKDSTALPPRLINWFSIYGICMSRFHPDMVKWPKVGNFQTHSSQFILPSSVKIISLSSVIGKIRKPNRLYQTKSRTFSAAVIYTLKIVSCILSGYPLYDRHIPYL